MLKRLFIYVHVFCLPVGMVPAQNKNPGMFRKELSFTTENDAYLLLKRDAYYTNGMIVSLRTSGEKKGGKLIRSFGVGQMIYTPLIRKTASPADIDRPYCGQLFFKYSQIRFPKNEAVLQLSGGITVLGRASLAESLQNSYHKLLKYARFSGWQYQVQNAVGPDMGISYARTVWENSSWIKIIPQVQANLGTTFINAGIGLYTCLGLFEKNSNSALWNARIQSNEKDDRRDYEFFIYWYPQFIWQGYNATVEGGLLNKGSGAVLGETERRIFQQNIGICYARGRWTTKAVWVYQSKESVSQKRAQQYGSFLLSYRLH